MSFLFIQKCPGFYNPNVKPIQFNFFLSLIFPCFNVNSILCVFYSGVLSAFNLSGMTINDPYQGLSFFKAK